MNWYQILCLIGIPTLSSLIVSAIWAWLINGSKKAKKIRQANNCDAIRSVVREENQEIKQDIKDMREQLRLVGGGTQAGLRNDILTCYYSCFSKGFKTKDDAENFNDMYEAYHRLGGNSFIDKDVMPSFTNLPLKPNDYQPSKKTKIRKTTSKTEKTVLNESNR